MTASMTIATDARANLRGAIWMILSMAAFAAEDGFIKLSASAMPVAQIMMGIGLCGMAIFAVMARIQGERVLQAQILSRVMLIRAAFELSGRLFYFLALTLIPLNLATVIMQATPIVVVAGAALFFGERVGLRRWAAILFGLLGVIVVIRPTGDGVSWLALPAILGMLGFAGRDLATRAAPASFSTAALGVYGFAAVFVAGALYGLWAQEPFVWRVGLSTAFLIGAVSFGVLGYASLMRAMRTGQVATVAPFRYSRLLFGLILGVWWFNESLDAATVAGCVMIVGSGLFIWFRGQQADR